MNKILHVGSVFKSVSQDEEGNDLIIRGMASTDDKDRVGDVIDPKAWKDGLKDYNNNPIILFNHDYNRPIGRALSVAPTSKGLELEAKISKAAGDIVELIKDGVLGAFSVGFMVKDADYDSKSDTFVIKQAELLEVSVVSVPANQAATFSVQKSFSSKEEYRDFVNSFKSVNLASGQELADNSNDALAGDTPEGHTVAVTQEKKMDEKEIQAMIADAVKGVSKEVATQIAMQRAEEKAAELAAQKAADEAAAQKTAEREAIVSVVRSGAEDLYADLQAKFAEKEANFDKIISEFRTELTEKSEELQKIQASKRVFADRNNGSVDFQKQFGDDIVNAHILGQITRKGWDTKFGREVLEKVNGNTGVVVPSSSTSDFESVISNSIERDIQLALILDPLFRKIQMNAASLVIPTLPDAGYAEWSANNTTGGAEGSVFKGNLEGRDAASPDSNSGIAMGSKVLTTGRLISRSYIANETEEDAILPVLPLIRESMVRAHARAIENSILVGGSTWDANSSAYNGLIKIAVDDSKLIDDSLSPTVGTATAADLLSARQAMGKYGRNARDVVYIVSLDAYYQLINDAEFQNLNEVGAQASKITGEVGQVFGSPVLVCDEFPGKAQGVPYAVAVNAMGFVVPVQRGTTVESDYSVENQRRVLVATQRRGFDQMFTTTGQVVAVTW